PQTHTGWVTSLLSISDPPPWVPTLPPSVFGCQDQEEDFPAVLTFKGVSVTLENNTIWKQFCQCGTEMILTKQGRRMFPYCRYRLAGLDPNRMYSLVLSIVPSSPFRYRWNTSRWEANGPTEHQSQGLIRAFPHHYSPCLGSDWMSCLVSFYKLKLTNCFQDQEGHMILHSMHRYIPRLHIIPVLDGATPTVDKPVVMGPESITFTFPQTEFMAVTTYQNFRITQLKINHNPFAKGFREDGNNSHDTAIVLLKANSGLRRPPKARPNKSSSSTGTPVRSIGFRKRRRRKIRSRWTMYYARTWRRAAAAAKPAHSPSLTLAMQPELDEIEGLLFVSFTSKVKLLIGACLERVDSEEILACWVKIILLKA
uniref:T-box domain-containing protein n=1 Tax=Poecilia latipinna TaxID=48699 RepID=A0A3B3V645_9TELE